MTETQARPETPNFLELNWAKHPDKFALHGLDRSLTYDQLRVRAQTLAKSLYGLGIRPGDQIAVMSYNLPEIMEISNALVYLEVGLVLVGFGMKPPEIEYIVTNSESRLLIFWHEFAERILPNRDNYPSLREDGFYTFGGSVDGALELDTLFANPPDVDLENLPPVEKVGSSMIYTSGTTGRPKGAARSTDFATKPGVMDYLFTSISFFRFDDSEVHLVCCPLYHSAPSYFGTISFIMGGTLVYMPRFDAEQFLELVDRYKVTSTHLVPTMVSRLVDVPTSITDKLDLSSLRSVVCGAAPLFPEQKLAFIKRYGPCLFEYYGATETGLNTAITPEEILERPGSVGKVFANNDLVIYDEQENEVPVNERGILYMHNPIMMDGYYKNEEATSEAYRGKHMTAGDVAIKDEDGYYYIVDRVKDMIIRGGVNIYPIEIESVIIRIPGVEDVAVVGQPHKELGEVVAAYIVINKENPVSEDEITAYCLKEMANVKVPSTIIFIDELPRTPTGKILKRELRDRFDAI